MGRVAEPDTGDAKLMRSNAVVGVSFALSPTLRSLKKKSFNVGLGLATR